MTTRLGRAAAALLGITAASLTFAAPPLELRGKITSEGRPVAGARIQAVLRESGLEAARREAQGAPVAPALAAAESRADGTFVLTLPASDAEVALRIEAGGFVTIRLDAPSSLASLGDVRLRPATTLAGRVVQAGGQPLAGATVTLEPGFLRFRGGDGDPEPVVARTGADGAFLVSGASESGNRLRVEADGFAPVSTAGLRSGRLEAPVALAPAQPLEGRVLARDGRSAAAGVLVHGMSGGVRTRYVLSDAEGRFLLKDAPSGAERVVAEGGALGRADLGLRGRPPGAVTLKLAAPSVLAGRIVDAASGTPVARARVEARGTLGSEDTRSDAEGRYRIEGLPPGEYRVSADEERHVPYARDGVEVLAGRSVSLDLPLRLASSVAGRVVDEEGRPVAGATGRLRASSSSRFELRRSLFGDDDGVAFRTGPDGTFKSARVAPGRGQQLTVSHPEFEPRTVAGLDLMAGRARSGVTVVMRRGLEIDGRVVDGEGHPVAAAQVDVRPSASERVGRGGMFFIEMPGRRGGEPSAQTAGDGRFRLQGLAPGAYSLGARKDGYAEAGLDPVRVEREEPAPSVELRLAPGAAIRGHVRHPDGRPAKRQMVRARPEGGSDPGAGPMGLGPLEPTGDDGAFAIEGLRAGETYTVQVLGLPGPGPGAMPRQTGVRAPADDVEIVVPGVGRIVGRAVDVASREPLPEFTARYEPDLPQGMGVRFMRALGRIGRRLGLGSEDDGAFRGPDGAFALEDVPTGTYSVVVEARGYEAARVSGVTVKEGETAAEVEVRVSRGRAVRGRVLDGASGRPVVGATVSAQEADRPGPPLPPGFEDGASFTDADGRFELPGLGLGMFKLVARHSDYSEASRLVEVQAAQAEVELRLSTGGVLGGVVVSEAGAPVGGASVQIGEGAQSAAGGVAFRIGGPGGGGAPQTLSDDNGQFRFDRLSAGRYTVTASLRGRNSAPVDVVLQAGETRGDLRVPLAAGATLRGRVVGLEASDLATANVTASGPQGYFGGVRPAPDGAFTLGGVPAGSIDLRAMAGDFGSGVRMASAQVEVAEGEAEVEAEIAFEAQGAIAGRVSRGGEGVGEVMISASGPAGMAAFSRSDGSGAYRIEGLKDGAYTVTASPPSGAAHRKSVEVAGEASLDFDLPLARLSGSVREAGSGLPLADAEVETDRGEASSGLSFARGRSRAVTDSTGRFSLEGLEPGPVNLTARRTGFGYERRAVEAREDGGPELTLELKRGEGLGLRVRDGVHGVPLRNLFGEARDASGATVFAGPLSLDSEGRGEVPSLRPGTYAVKLMSGGYAPASFRATVPSPTLEVALTEGGVLEVRSGPETQARAPRARLLDAAGVPVMGPPLGPDGFFTLAGAVRRLEHLAPGLYSLVVEGGPTKAVTVTEGKVEGIALP